LGVWVRRSPRLVQSDDLERDGLGLLETVTGDERSTHRYHYYAATATTWILDKLCWEDIYMGIIPLGGSPGPLD
jgi:hypothetical protein